MIQRPIKYLKKSAFTMLEVIFVIVIIGLLSKFGLDLFSQSYKNYIFTKINNKLQNQSSTAVEFIAKRLSYRIPDSVIGRASSTNFDGVQELDASTNYIALEWVSTDIDGWRGDTAPFWSGIADLDLCSNSNIFTPNTNIDKIDDLIKWLSKDGASSSSLSDAAIYFIGSNSDAQTSYGWQGGVNISGNLNAAMHPITATIDNNFAGSFANIDLYEYYKLSWTANAIVIEDDLKGNGTYNLVFYFDYQPWNGERYTDGRSSIIMENVPTFKFRAIGNMLKVQVCVKSELTSGAHAICKEKTVF